MHETMITEDIIEKLCGKNISDVTKLNLSGRRFKHIHVGAFREVAAHLSVLDLSHNELRSVPSSLGLIALTHLDVSDNCLESLEFVEQMPLLSDLQLEGNGLLLADRLTAVFLCPSLAKIDNILTDRLKSTVQNCRNKFLPMIEMTWTEHFADKYADGIKTCDLDTVMQELLLKVKQRKLCAPGVPPSFREFMVNKLTTELIMQASCGHYKPHCSQRLQSNGSPCDIEAMDVDDVKSPNKLRSPAPSSSSKLHSCPPLPDYEPHRFIRCHFCDKNALKNGHTDDDPTDETTTVWCCAMEPDPNDSGKSTGVVATCGGDTVCLIDCGTGQVMKRFKQLREEFYCAAWTTLTLENNDSKSRTNILAVGGFNGHLRLIHPAQLACYAEHGSGRPNRTVSSFYYNCLVFHPRRPTWLFCGSSDTTITLFDIGVPHGADYKTEITQLAVLVTSRQAAILNMAISLPTGHLVAGTEDGCFTWDVNAGVAIDAQRGTKHRCEPSLELSLPVTGKPFVDGLVFIDENYIACKCAGNGYIYVINVTDALQRQNAGRVYGFMWTKTDTKYIGLGSANGILACGDHLGSIWLYDVQSVLSSRQKNFSKFLSPSRVLVWPECTLDETNEGAQKMVDVLEKPEPLIINYVTVSAGGEFIVAGTDCNLVCIWKRTK